MVEVELQNLSLVDSTEETPRRPGACSRSSRRRTTTLEAPARWRTRVDDVGRREVPARAGRRRGAAAGRPRRARVAPGRAGVAVAEPKLREYRRKRDPKKTAEPFASGRKRGKKPLFVVQRHDARRLHYDFRLERDGVLASWAVPKGIPLEPGLQHLAVHVEDHPLELRDLRGRDPEGRVRRGHGRDLGHGHVRGPRGEAERRSHGAARGTEARRDLGPRPGEARRRREELAAHPQARGGNRAGGPAAQVRADARDPRGDERDAARRRVGVRDQVGRLPHRRAGRRRRGSAPHPQGPGLHAALRQGREGARQGAQDPRLRGRRRGVRARRERAPELLRDAAGEGRARRSSTTCSTCSRWTASR